jgi:DNA-directed RNA polymerase subunit omega
LIKSACSPNVHQRSGGGDADHTEMKLRPCVTGIVSAAEGITNPPIDELLDRTGSKYALVIVAAKRARQINAYYSQLGEGLLEYVGPMVETAPQEKALSIALREINSALIEFKPSEA